METSTLIKMNDALHHLKFSNGGKAVNKVYELRDRHAILYNLTEEQFGVVKRIALKRNILEGSCRMIDRNKIPD